MSTPPKYIPLINLCKRWERSFAPFSELYYEVLHNFLFEIIVRTD